MNKVLHRTHILRVVRYSIIHLYMVGQKVDHELLPLQAYLSSYLCISFKVVSFHCHTFLPAAVTLLEVLLQTFFL